MTLSKDRKVLQLNGDGVYRAKTQPGACSLKFQMAILQIHCYFLLIKCENPFNCKGFSHFINKNNSVLAYVVSIYLSIWGLNSDVNLTKV